MSVVLVFEKGVLGLICGHALHSGRCLEERESFYDVLKVSWLCIMQMILLCA